MIHKTRGIVLNHTRYGDSSAIVHVYTSMFGMQSYMANRVFGKRKKSNGLLLQPLNVLEMEVYHHSNKEIHRIKEFRPVRPLLRIPYSQTRRAQAFLITEILSRGLRGEGKNQYLFEFLDQSVEFMDGDHSGMENYHIWFLFNLTRYLGLFPHNNFSDAYSRFDIKEGCFVSGEPSHPYFLNKEESGWLASLFHIEVEQLADIAENVTRRRQLLNSIVLFYEFHHQEIGKIRSLDVLKELFS
ncbi:DNA repair protein RecO [Natronoflexus pectinivorans]|uniref:DNA repair protein RecO n=1 Tax=Natronoflexus pectinivorans TaxID=682526 RepID=A0A4R2GLQ2_9BACT|nr:DNA repair protein RecO [Natronoflexus pectinivorans]TCO08421.1 DNA replication and repair protein RecO [Natronoflexus pectinivorans]